MSEFSELAWNEINNSIYEDIKELNFVKELSEGTLSKDKFEFYIKQDKLYLIEFAKVLSMISAKINDIEDSNKFLIYAKDMMDVERELHNGFIELFENEEDLKASPSCLLYTGYLHTILNTAPLCVIVASVVPCFWIYQEVGKHILNTQNKNNNIYQEWINTYASEDYENVVKDILRILDKLAEKANKEEKEEMLEAFKKASALEWMFWDSAYKLEEWPI